jgi:tRNA dimethylallyltransferase
LTVAERLGDVELVSIDSMQVYRGMDIGTAKPTPEDRTRVPHHMIDIADPAEDFSVARFQAEARAAIAAVAARGNRALLVGGTGLYLRAVVDDLRFPPEDRELRELIDARYPGDDGLARAYTDLTLRDARAASRIEPGNRRRIVRALEVIQSTGRPFSSFGAGLAGPLDPVVPVRIAGIDVDRSVTGARIAARLQHMVAAGLVDEVRRLAAAPWSRTARQAIGYKEVLEYLRGTITPLDLALMAVETRTRRFARRQESWFRRDRRIAWFGDGTKTPPDAAAVVAWWSGP